MRCMKFQPPRGTRDFLPKDMAVRREMFRKIRSVFESYGYGEVWTPAFEDFALLARKAGPDIEKELYVFTDKSGRKLGLRFDPTVPIARIVASTPSLPKPVKFYYITNMWRYDRPQAGRFREFWQAGVELIGSPRPEADAEVVALVAESLQALGITGFLFRLNSREIAENIVRNAGVSEDKKYDAFRALDKLGKIGEAGVRREMEKCGIAAGQATKILSALKTQKKPAGKLQAVMKLLRERGIRNVVFDPSIVRGIDYYTGFVFETFIRGKEHLGSVASGGRYDSLIGLYGSGLPATGFGIGIERLMEVVGNQHAAVPSACVIAVNEKMTANAVAVAGKLRQSGVAAETDIMGRSFGKQLAYANSKGIPWVIFVGEKEVRSGRYTLRDMKTGKEHHTTVSALVRRLTGT